MEEELKGKKSMYWKPETKGEEIVGVMVESRNDKDYGLQCRIENKMQDIDVWTPSHRVLQNKLQEAKVGDKLRIIYDGEEETSKQGKNPTKLYRVFRIRTEKVRVETVEE